MTVRIDSQGEAEVARRLASGKDATIDIGITRAPGCGFVADVHWGARLRNADGPAVRCGDTTVTVDPRIARYAAWHDIVISAEHVGPLSTLMLRDPIVLHTVAEWERSHPALLPRARANCVRG